MPISLLLATLLTMNAEVSVSAGPNPELSSSCYQGSRAPLKGTPFIKLPVGTVTPRGWLLECLKRQRNGLCGHLGEISAWLVKDHNAWLSKDGSGENGWEEVPYWLKGFADMGYILRDQKVIAEAKVWLEGVLSSQRADGNFGPTRVDENGVEDFWPKMPMLYCLQSYYEYSADQRIPEFMTRFFRYELNYPEAKFMQQYWQSRRTGDNLYSVLWLYNITGDSFLLDLAAKLHRKGVDWAPKHVSAADWFQSMPDWHNVNIAQGFREPATYWLVSHKDSDRRATYNAFKTVREYFGQVPGGMFGADENARPGYSDPRQAIETCGMVEQMNSDEQLMRMTGDVFWADNAENVAFNSYPAALMPDFRSLRYLTSPNVVQNDEKDHHPGIANSGPFMMMNPFSSRCCQHNHSQGWPYYVENLWLATSDDGVAAALYGASRVALKVADQVPVTIDETTRYPFEDELEFTVHSPKPVSFPLYLRVPGWCASPSVFVEGRKVTVLEAAGKYIKIQREWRDGDRVRLHLPMQVSVKTWRKNRDSVSANYGPLTFSLKIDERYVKQEASQSLQQDSHFQKGVDENAWPAYEIYAASPWNYGLVLNESNPASSFSISKRPWPKDDYPFTLTSCPIVLSARGRQIPDWKIDQFGLCGVLDQSPVRSDQPETKLELVPMGTARLRISAFPTTASTNEKRPRD
jgi:hypothetical protein